MDRESCLGKLASALARRQPSHPLRVAIDGVDGVGKTTLADELAERLRNTGREVIRASVDGFHHPRERRYRRGVDSPEGYFLDSFDYEALACELLRPLGPGGNRVYRPAVFDYRIDSAVDVASRHATRDAILLFDGVFLLRPELVSYWDLRVWVDAPFEVTVERAIKRDAGDEEQLESLRRQYERRYVPGQRLYMSRCRPIESADLIVNNEDVAKPEVRES